MYYSLLAAVMAVFLCACGGGGSVPVLDAYALLPVVPAPRAFEESWQQLDVAGYVFDVPLIITPDHSDPQTGWSNQITGKWGTLAGLDSVTGTASSSWGVADGRLYFHATDTSGFALISRQTFSRLTPIAVEADFTITAGTDTAFAELTLIAGEGDFRGLALYRRGAVIGVDRVAPLEGTKLAEARPGLNKLRLEYDPMTGWRYLLNGALIGTEAIDHLGASFAHDPSVGLYFAADFPKRPGSFVEGSVGPVAVWQ